MEIIKKGAELLNIKIPQKVAKAIVHYSNGLASVCHQLCLNICFCAEIFKTVRPKQTLDSSIIEEALTLYLEGTSDTLKNSFEKAFKLGNQRKHRNSDIIIKALSYCSQEGASRSEIFNKIKIEIDQYPQGNLTNYLKKLQTDEFGSIIRYEPNSGRYYFSNPIYRAFSQVYFRSGYIQHSEALLDITEELMGFLKLEVRKMAKLANGKL